MLAGLIFLVPVLLSNYVLCLEVKRALNVEYHMDSDDITVQVNLSHFNSSSYQVEHFMNQCSKKNNSSVKKDVFSPHEVKNLKISVPFESNWFCVLVTPLNMLNETECQSPCQPLFQELYLNLRDKEHCQDWQADLYSEVGHVGTNQITYRLKINREFQSCFTEIIIVLWYDVYQECDTVSGKRKDEKTIKLASDPEDWTKIVFDNLIPGNYCIRLYTFHSSCKNGNCTIRRSKLLTIDNNTPGVTGPFLSGDHTEESSLIYIVVGCVVFAIIIVAVSVYCCKKLRTRFPISVNEKGLTLTELIALAKDKAHRLEIVLLYSQDMENHSKAVQALYHFMLQCFGVCSVRFDQMEESSISVNLHSWVESVLRPRRNRVFVIVESEGAVLQENGRTDKKLVRPENEDFLDDVFPYALQLLKDKTRGFCDYRTVFVVKFKYTPDDLRLNCIVPNCRFTLPKHLFELYCALLDLPKPSVEILKKFEDKMNKEWQGSLNEDLISKIEDAFKTVTSNPRIVQDSFTEQDLFTYV